jgi:alkyl sulfatase BDS1-like metallo-beta-lactamase superfamily hydrolase
MSRTTGELATLVIATLASRMTPDQQRAAADDVDQLAADAEEDADREFYETCALALRRHADSKESAS